MKISYKISFEDTLYFSKYQAFNRINPSINDAIKRLNRLIFLCLFFVEPFLLYLLNRFQSPKWIMVYFSLALFIYMIVNYKKNIISIWWKIYQPKLERDLLATIYTNKQELLEKAISIKGETIYLESTFSKRTYQKNKIRLIDYEDSYFYLFFSDYKGTLIPQRYLDQDSLEYLTNMMNSK